MICHICRRASRGFRYDGPGMATRHYCSRECQIMRDPTREEVAAMDAAGANGGEYLDELGKTDLATMTPEEWMTFIECVCTGFTEHLRGGC